MELRPPRGLVAVNTRAVIEFRARNCFLSLVCAELPVVSNRLTQGIVVVIGFAIWNWRTEYMDHFGLLATGHAAPSRRPEQPRTESSFQPVGCIVSGAAGSSGEPFVVVRVLEALGGSYQSNMVSKTRCYPDAP